MKVFNLGSMDLISRRWKIREALMKDPDERSPVEIQNISDHLSVFSIQNNEFLTKNSSPEQLLMISKHLTLTGYSKDSYIFHQGDEGDNFYIIFEGRIGIYIQGKGKVAEINKDESLGELALLYGQARAASAKALEYTDLIVLSKSIYEDTIKVSFNETLHIEHSEEYITFFESIPMMQSISDNTIKVLVQALILRRFPAGTILTNQGSKSGGIHIIYSGSVKLHREIEFRKSKTGKIESMTKPPKGDESTDDIPIVIDELNEGGIFGAHEFLENLEMQYTAVCSMPCEIFLIDSHGLEKLDLEEINEIKRKTCLYPEDERLRKIHLEDKRWKIYRKRLVENIRREKELRKVSMRSVPKLPIKKLELGSIRLPPLARSKSTVRTCR